jgi:hypothetical protein
MADLFVNLVGAAIFSIIGMFYIKNRGKGTVAESFIPQMKEPEKISGNKKTP